MQKRKYHRCAECKSIRTDWASSWKGWHEIVHCKNCGNEFKTPE